jgi:hypothetical protein
MLPPRAYWLERHRSSYACDWEARSILAEASVASFGMETDPSMGDFSPVIRPRQGTLLLRGCGTNRAVLWYATPPCSRKRSHSFALGRVRILP